MNWIINFKHWVFITNKILPSDYLIHRQKLENKIKVKIAYRRKKKKNNLIYQYLWRGKYYNKRNTTCYIDNCQSHEIKTKSLSFNSCEKVLFSFRRRIKSSKDGGWLESSKYSLIYKAALDFSFLFCNW